MIAHNLFRFDFFFFLKGVRASSWRTRDISIGGSNPTDINFANNCNQIAFIDTFKYFQQSLVFLAKTMAEEEKEAVKIGCKNSLLSGPKLARMFNECTKEDQKWVLTYLFLGKDVITYEMITRFDSLDISPEENQFFLPH